MLAWQRDRAIHTVCLAGATCDASRRLRRRASVGQRPPEPHSPAPLTAVQRLYSSYELADKVAIAEAQRAAARTQREQAAHQREQNARAFAAPVARSAIAAAEPVR